MAFSDYFGGSGGFTLDPATQLQIEDINKPLPQQSMGGKVSAWLANPENRLMLLNMGKAISPSGIAGGKEYQTLGGRISDAFAPGVKGEIAQQKAQSVEGAVATGVQNPKSIQGAKASGIIPGKASSALGEHSFDMSSPDFTGLTHTIKPDGTVSYSIKSPGPKDYNSAKIIADQQASGQVPAQNVGQSPTPVSAALGNPDPFVASQGGNAGSPGEEFLPAIFKAEGTGGKDYYPDGRPIVSPKGARFAMQVMPATAKNPGFGIQPAMDESPAEYNRVGREYYTALLNRYKDPAKAFAAYNGGFDRVDAAVAKYGDNWLQGMPEETQQYVPRAMGQVAGGQARPTMFAQAQPNYGTVTDVPVSYAPPERFSSYLGNSPVVKGLDPAEVTQATELGMRAAKLPYDISHTAAATKLTDAQADVARQGLVTNKPLQLTLPGGQKLTTTGKDYLDYVQKVDHNALLKQHYEVQLAQAQDLKAVRDATIGLKNAQEEERKLKSAELKAEADLVDKMGDKKVPGSDLSFKEAHILGILKDLLRQDQATQVAINKQNLSLAEDVRKRHAKLKAEFSNPLANLDYKNEAKARKITMDQLFELKMSEEYPNWKRYMSPQQGESIRVGGPAKFKFNPATGKIE